MFQQLCTESVNSVFKHPLDLSQFSEFIASLTTVLCHTNHLRKCTWNAAMSSPSRLPLLSCSVCQMSSVSLPLLLIMITVLTVVLHGAGKSGKLGDCSKDAKS